MEVTLRAETGREQGSRPSRRLRRQGQVPAVVYGKDTEPVAVAVDARELYAALHTEAGLNALINLQIGKKKLLTMAREVQRHPVRGDVIHVDFLTISLTEKTQVEVGFEFIGEPEGAKEGGILETIRSTIEVEALPTDIPTAIPVDVSGLNIGDTLRVEDLVPIEGVTYLADPDEPIVTLAVPAAVLAEEEVEEEELEEGEEAAAEEGEETEAGDE
jgi:large subunit ribosomal protein L25